MKLRYGPGDWRKSEHELMGRTKHIFLRYLLNRGGYMKNWAARLRAVWHAWFLMYDGEICKDCGRPVARGIGTWWNAPDGLWMDINGGFAGCLCPSCFAQRCQEKEGLLIYWVPLIERRDVAKMAEDDQLAHDAKQLSVLEQRIRDGSRLE